MHKINNKHTISRIKDFLSLFKKKKFQKEDKRERKKIKTNINFQSRHIFVVVVNGNEQTGVRIQLYLCVDYLLCY